MGVNLIPMLVSGGYEVVGMTRTPAKVPLLTTLGAIAVLCDVFDTEALHDLVATCAPDVLMHQLTDLPDDQAEIPQRGAATIRMRIEGTDSLLDAATAVGVPLVVAQSVAWQLSEHGARAIAHLESAVLSFPGTVLRYGQWYGPGTYYASGKPAVPRIQIDAAARCTVEALGRKRGLYEVIEDDAGSACLRPA
jgi:nucleoside-diphosphate-sugar epimerase